jgi:cytochrome P450
MNLYYFVASNLVLCLIFYLLVNVKFNYPLWVKKIPIISHHKFIDLHAGSFGSLFLKTDDIVTNLNRHFKHYKSNMLRLSFIFSKDVVVITDPIIAKSILSEIPSIKTGFTYKILENFTGGSGDLIGILDSNHPFYRLNRVKIMNLIYKFFYTHFNSYILPSITKLIENWGGKTLDVKVIFHTFISELMANLLLGFSNKQEIEQLRHHFEWLVNDVSQRPYAYFLPYYTYFPSKANREYNYHQKEITRLINIIINTNTSDDNIISLLKSDPANTSEELVGCIKLLFFAGHETTATVLSWIFYYLGTNKKILTNVQIEIDNLLETESLTFSNLFKLPYTKSVIYEALRLKPIVNTTCRKITKSHSNITPYDGPCMFFTQGIHTNSQYWDHPHDFKPQRFLNGEGQKEGAMWLPFSWGKRQCIGKDFAISEMLTFVVLICFKYDFILSPSCHVIEKTKITMEPWPDVTLILQERKSSALNTTEESVNEKCIVIYKGEKYDVTSFLDIHPGGRNTLLFYQNKDITEAFETTNHSKFAMELLKKYIVN